MSTETVAKRLVALCNEGHGEKAVSELYGKDIVSIEASGTPEMPARIQGIAAVERVTGHRVPFVSAARRPGDPVALYASSARVREELGWVPQRVSLETIVTDAWRCHSNYPQGFRR